MKRIFTMLLLITFTFTLTGCQSKEDQFQTAMENMRNLENATMDMTMSMSLFGEDVDLTSTAKIDGSMMMMEIFGEDSYIMNYDDNTFELIDMGNGLFGAVYSPDQDEEDDFFGLPDIEDLTFEDFDIEDDYFVYNGDIEDLGNFKMKIEDGYIVEMILEVSEDFEGMTMSMTLTIDIYDLGSTTIANKPNVPHFEDYAPILLSLYEEGYTVMYEGDQIVVIGPNNFSTVFQPDQDFSWGSIELNPTENTIWTYDGENEDFFDFDTYYNAPITQQVPRDILELIDQLFDIWVE